MEKEYNSKDEYFSHSVFSDRLIAQYKLADKWNTKVQYDWYKYLNGEKVTHVGQLTYCPSVTTQWIDCRTYLERTCELNR